MPRMEDKEKYVTWTRLTSFHFLFIFIVYPWVWQLRGYVWGRNTSIMAPLSISHQTALLRNWRVVIETAETKLYGFLLRSCSPLSRNSSDVIASEHK